MLPDRVSNPGPLTYELGALPIALRGPAQMLIAPCGSETVVLTIPVTDSSKDEKKYTEHTLIRLYILNQT